MDYNKMNVAKLRAEHKARGLTGYSKLRRAELIERLETRDQTEALKLAEVEEVVEHLQPVQVKGRSVGYTTMGVADSPSVEERLDALALKQADKRRKTRNKAKARRRTLRAAGSPAGF